MGDEGRLITTDARDAQSRHNSIGMRGDTVILVSSGFVNITQFFAVIPAIILIDRLGGRGICFFVE